MSKPTMSETLAAAARGYDATVMLMDRVDDMAGGYATARGMRREYDDVQAKVSKARDNLDCVLRDCTAADVAHARADHPAIDDTIYYAEKRIGLR